jgi:di/tripeptidase
VILIKSQTENTSKGAMIEMQDLPKEKGNNLKEGRFHISKMVNHLSLTLRLKDHLVTGSEKDHLIVSFNSRIENKKYFLRETITEKGKNHRTRDIYPSKKGQDHRDDL